MRARSWLPVLLLAAAVGAAVPGACRRPDSVLLIEVAGPVGVQPVQFRVIVTTGAESRVLDVPMDPTDPLTLPVSFSVELDRSRTGPVTVSIEAFDAGRSMIGCGNTVQQHIEI